MLCWRGQSRSFVDDSRVNVARAAVTWSRKLVTYTTQGGGKYVTFLLGVGS